MPMHLKHDIPPREVLHAQLPLHDANRQVPPEGAARVAQGDQVVEGQLGGLEDGGVDFEGEHGKEEVWLGGGFVGEKGFLGEEVEGVFFGVEGLWLWLGCVLWYGVTAGADGELGHAREQKGDGRVGVCLFRFIVGGLRLFFWLLLWLWW